MRRIKRFIPPLTLQTIYKTLVQLYFDYCRAARIITGASYDVRSADVLDTLGWEKLDARRSRNKSILMYKILNDQTAPNLKDLFRKKYETHQNALNL